MPAIKPFRQLPALQKKEFNHDFADHVWFMNLFNDSEVVQIRNLWNDELVVDAKVVDQGAANLRDDLRKSRVMWIKPGANNWIYDRLEQACNQTNQKRYRFEITGFQTELQLADYAGGGFFEWHMDFGAGDTSNRKLSITVQLSDPDEYAGGDLQFMINQKIVNAPRTKGTAIIFPSFCMHRVEPVLSGRRQSIVGWIAGPSYR